MEGQNLLIGLGYNTERSQAWIVRGSQRLGLEEDEGPCTCLKKKEKVNGPGCARTRALGVTKYL